jgi:23S rRNA (cytidine1920-2'-O)/16S rRNA (cytidine1409-2'-O)-methyltransferase
MERTNLRGLEALPEPVQMATLDMSFIGLRQVLPAVRRLLTDDGQVVALIKPQFEAGRGVVPRGGVVHDPVVHREVLVRFGADLPGAGFTAIGLVRSPITGTEGNVEFLAHLAAGPMHANQRSALEPRWNETVDALTPLAP